MTKQLKPSLFLLLVLVSFAVIGAQLNSIPMVNAVSEQTYKSHPKAWDSDISVTNPTNAYDANLVTFAQFEYSSSSGTKTGLDLYDFDSPTEVPSKVYGSLPSISRVDLTMRYNASENLGAKNDFYRIVYYVSATAVGAGDTTENVTLVDWTNV